jgi:hypothetical protein
MRRDVTIDFFDLQPSVQIESLLDQTKVMYYAAAKWIGVKDGSLTKLWCELVAINLDAASPYTATIDADCLCAQDAARVACKDAFDNSSITTADLADQKMNEIYSDLLLIDDTFKLERAVAKLVSSSESDGGLKNAVLAILPSSEDSVDLSMAVMKINTLIRGKLFTFSSRSAQAKATDMFTI